MNWRWLIDYLLLGVLLALVGLVLSIGLVALLAWLLPAGTVTAVLTIFFLLLITIALVVTWQRHKKS